MALARHFVTKGWKIVMFDINEDVGSKLGTCYLSLSANHNF